MGFALVTIIPAAVILVLIIAAVIFLISKSRK